MPTFRYEALDANGRTVVGKLAGASEAAILGELAQRSLVPVQVRVENAAPVFRSAAGWVRGSWPTAYQQMADLLRAGVPLMRALALLARGKSKPRRAEIFRQLAEAVSRGEDLADAMAAQDGVFPRHARGDGPSRGEKSGSLEPVLVRLASMVMAQAELRAKLLGALTYPAVLVLVGTVVPGRDLRPVPAHVRQRARAGRSAPADHRGLVCHQRRGHRQGPGHRGRCWPSWRWWPGGSASGRRWPGRWRSPRPRAPVLGPLVRNIAVGRFCRTFGTMLANGVPVLTAMRIAEDAAGNQLLKEAVAQAAEAVRSGQTLAGPLGESGLFDEDVIEMIAVGESANNLPEVLETIAQTIETRVGRLLTTAVSLVGPAMLLVLAVVVAFVAIGLILPMLELSRVA
ncbi:MAG: type II secretion system protein GspF [Phycisphaerales bacterium]|nr:MAG: type II secretion system protein GspF [Phycisphaerales bacterium]